jgi:hypothetical protein
MSNKTSKVPPYKAMPPISHDYFYRNIYDCKIIYIIALLVVIMILLMVTAIINIKL